MKDFVFIFIGTLVGSIISRLYLRTEFRLREDELLEEIRKLCNDLLKRKDRKTIKITKLEVATTKHPTCVITKEIKK